MKLKENFKLIFNARKHQTNALYNLHKIRKNIIFILAQDKIYNPQTGLISITFLVLKVSTQIMRNTLSNSVD